MTIWIDAQQSPDLAPWFRERLGLTAVAVRDLQLRDATDEVILWLTCGNTSNPALTRILDRTWPAAAQMLAAGEPLVEIDGANALL